MDIYGNCWQSSVILPEWRRSVRLSILCLFFLLIMHTLFFSWAFFQKARSFSGDYVRLYLRSVHSSYGLPVERDGFPIS